MKKRTKMLYALIIVLAISLIIGIIEIVQSVKELILYYKFNALSLVVLPLEEAFGLWQIFVLFPKCFKKKNHKDEELNDIENSEKGNQI